MKKYLIPLFAALGVIVSLIPARLRAEVPRLISYQGQMADAAGSQVNLGTESEFSLYTHPIAGEAIWSEAGYSRMSDENPGLPFRRSISVTNSGAALSNHQVRVVINTATLIAGGRMRVDGADIRFTTADCLTSLDYWIESGINTAETVIWVNLPAIPVGDSRILIHYGNPGSAPASDGESTFIFFDDFKNGLGKWINVSGSPWEIYDGTLRITNPAVLNNYLVADQSLGAAGIIIEVRMKSRHTSSDGHPGLIWHANTALGNSQRNDQIYFRPHSYNTNSNNQPGYFNGGLVTFGNAYGLYNYNTWYNIRIDLVSANSVRVYRNGVNEANFSNQQFQGNTYAGIMTHNGNTQQWDDFRVRKYTDLQPTTRVGVEMMVWTGEEDWSRRRLLLIDGGMVQEDLFAFPVLVRLGPDDDWSGFKASGEDIRFVDFAGEWELPYEIESWEEGVEAVIWVGCPLLAAGEDTRFWMYFGNPAAVSVERQESLWDGDYRLVLHAAGSGGEEVFRAVSSGYDDNPGGITSMSRGN